MMIENKMNFDFLDVNRFNNVSRLSSRSKYDGLMVYGFFFFIVKRQLIFFKRERKVAFDEGMVRSEMYIRISASSGMERGESKTLANRIN